MLSADIYPARPPTFFSSSVLLFKSGALSAACLCPSLTPHAGDPRPASWRRPIRHLSVWNEVRVTPSIKILHQVLLWSTLFIFAVCVGITAVLLDPHAFGPSGPKLN